MQIAATDLKAALKRLAPLKTDTYHLSATGIQAQDSDALVSVDGVYEFPETFGVNGKKLTQVVNRMSGQVSLDLEPNKLVIRSNRAKVELEIQKVKPFTIPEIPTKLIRFSLPEFKKIVQTASQGVSPIKSKGYGNCVRLASLPLPLEDETPNGYAVEGAGDGALILTRVVRKERMPFEFSMSLNLSACSVVQLMDGPEVEIGESNQCVYASAPGVKVYASRPFAPYDNFGPVFLLPSKAIFQIETGAFASAIKTVEPLADAEDNSRVSCKFTENMLVLYSESQGSRAEDQLPYQQLEPDEVFEPLDLTVKLSARHLNGFINKAGETFRLHTTTSFPVKLESGDVTVLTMPVK